MSDKLANYKRANAPLPKHNMAWPLYGAGLENLGIDNKPIEIPLPEYGPDELLVRHDAVGLCFSDIKIIRLGEEHPRIYRKMQTNPVVMGHEVIMTIVGVGQNLRGQYNIGERYIIQADVFVGGVGYAYGYEIQGGLSWYNVIDQRVLNGDGGNYLLPVQPTTGYAEGALTEPWACVIAAYQLKYRTQLKPKGITWIVGSSAQDPRPYTISAGFDEKSHPDKLLLSNVPANFAAWLKERAAALNVPVIEVADVTTPPVEQVDDIALLNPTPDLIETVSPHLADFGVVALLADKPLPRNVDVDMGRIHYNRWVYVGSTNPDIATAYNKVPVRSTLKSRGRAWFVGAGGPIGRMHVQRAIQVANGPGTIVCTDVSDLRLNDLYQSFAAEAEAQGIDLICLNPMDKETYAAGMAPFKEQGFDDIIVLAPVAPLIADSATYLAAEGVMNVFAGVARGTMVNLNLSDVYLKDARSIGHSASTIEDLQLMLNQAESGQLSPNRAVAAIGSLNAAKDGMQALQNATYPGKVVIFPQIKDFPLTALPDLKEKLPTVYAKLKNGREWTVEAEQEFLELMLP
jgi:threonine dehydrogenase-like Zn-dependent dehydrogenase